MMETGLFLRIQVYEEQLWGSAMTPDFSVLSGRLARRIGVVASRY